MNTDVAVLITTYCGDPNKELKEYMTERLCESLYKTTDYYICLVSHSPINFKTQQYCNSYIYDDDNRFRINGFPDCENSFLIAELTSIHNGINYLKSKGFKKFIKITYDCDPSIDFEYLIDSCVKTNKDLVSVRFQDLEDAIGTFVFMSGINFFQEILPLKNCYKYTTYTEWCLYNSLREQNKLNNVHLEKGYYDFFGLNIDQYSFYGGTQIKPYNY